MRQKGFTLIELLVVITIIGVLAAITLFAINPLEQMRRSRDAARIQDLITIRKALDITIVNHSAGVLAGINCQYTDPCTSLVGSREANGTGWLPVDVGDIIPVLPIDPLNGLTSASSSGPLKTFRYFFASNSDQYTVATYLESTENIPIAATDGGNSASLYELGTGPANILVAP